jgi:hypothetical protein
MPKIKLANFGKEILIKFIIVMAILLFILILYSLNKTAENAEINITSIEITSTTTSTTTTTVPIKLIENVDLNFTTPVLRRNKTYFLTNRFFVYINDSFLRIIDPDGSKGIYNSSIETVKEAFKIWEEETKLISFVFVNSSKNSSLIVEWSAEMPKPKIGSEAVIYTIAYTIPYIHRCGNYSFVTGGKIVFSTQAMGELAVALHEIGHILNLADVGNKDSIMCWLYEENSRFSTQELREKITKEIKETLKLIVRPDYDCYPGIKGCAEDEILCNDECWEGCGEHQIANCTPEGLVCEYNASFGCPKNSIFCNSKCWEYCSEGYTFYCYEGGEICKISEECPSGFINCYGKCYPKCDENSTFYCYPEGGYCRIIITITMPV